MSDSRDDRIYRTPLVRFSENNLYFVRLNVEWNHLEDTGRTELFWQEVTVQATVDSRLLFSGAELKVIWADAQERTEYENTPINYDVISRCLKESMIIDTRELLNYTGIIT